LFGSGLCLGSGGRSDSRWHTGARRGSRGLQPGRPAALPARAPRRRAAGLGPRVSHGRRAEDPGRPGPTPAKPPKSPSDPTPLRSPSSPASPLPQPGPAAATSDGTRRQTTADDCCSAAPGSEARLCCLTLPLNSLIARVNRVTLIAREIKELMWSRKRRNASSEGPKQS
jgi:hypothetical protein